MYSKLKQILKIRGMTLTIEIVLIVIAFISIRTYTQQDLLQGQAPSLVGKLLNGKSISLESLNGRPILLHFWATWCAICKLEQQSIESMSKQYTILSVAMNSGNANEIRQFMQNQQLTFPVVVDEYGDIAKQFAVRGVPTSYFINSNGRIVSSEIGFTSAWGLRLRMWWVSQ